jgi:hypothetical protein
LKERELWDNPEQDGSARYWRISGRKERAQKKFTHKRGERDWRLLVHWSV